MIRIKTFESYNSDILYIFDFDETIVKTPSFEELSIDFLKEHVSIENMLKSSINKIGVNLSDIKWENGRLYINDPYQKINVNGNWVRKNSRVYLITPNIFPFTDISLPKKLKSLSKMYNEVKNKCIVTARPEDMRSKIIEVMNNLNLEMPEYGLFMFPAGKGAGNSGIWKGNKICEVIQENKFKKAHFFDDNSKIVNKVKKIVKEKLPNIEFVTTRVV